MKSPAATPARARRGPWRWAVALVATAALVISGSGLVVFAQNGAGESQGPVFVPAETPIYLEVRLDLPAGQDEALAQMLTAFPGFADAGSFDLKVDEVVAGLAGEMGLDAAEVDLIGDVVTGEIGLAVGDLEAAVSGGGDPAMLIGLAVADAELAASMLSTMAGDVGEEMYGDAAILSDMTTSAAVHSGWMLLSNDIEQVKAAIDVLDGSAPSLADDAGFASAFARVPSGHLGAAYVDLQSFGSFIDMAGMMAAGETGMDLPMADLAAMLPADMVMFLAAEPDRMNLEVLVTPGEATPGAPVGDSELANVFPADTQLYVETRELGSAVETALNGLVELLAAQAEMLPSDGAAGGMGGLSEIEVLFGEESPFTDLLGAPLPEFLDFVVDASVGAGLSSDGLWFGVAGEVSDDAIAEDRVGSLLTLIRLFAGNPAESGISIETETVGDVEVSRIMLPLDELTAGSGLPITLGDSISVAVSDGRLLIGMGDFVQAALSADVADSLGASVAYTDAIGADTVNAGLMYMNVSSLLGALDPLLSATMPEWSAIAPYATGVDRIVLVSTADDGLAHTRMTAIVNR